nr:cupin domain-containing protein [Nocardia flavorosea]
MVDGELTIQMRDGDVQVRPGQLFVVPKGVEHCPVADGEVHAMLIEPAGVQNTGDAGGSLTARYDDSLA